MAKMTPGNRLYLYQLLSRELGVRRQTLLPRVEEVLEADGLCVEDLGCSTMRELCEKLDEFIKLTVFKKGYVYATVISNEEYDRALEASARGADTKAPGNKPWKRRRGAKALKPMKPRHVEKAAEPEAVVPEDETAAEKDMEPEAGVVQTEAAAEKDTGAEAVDAQTEAGAEKDAGAEAEGAQATAAEPGAEAEVEAEVLLAPEAETDAAAESAAEPGPTPEPDPAPAAAPVPAEAPKPSISLTITYVPEPEEPVESAVAPEPAPEPAPGPAPAAPPLPVAPATPAAPPKPSLPCDFHTDVRCPSEQLSALYQVLPPDVDPLGTLEEDFRAARSTGTVEGTRSSVSFPLRYLRSDGSGPVRVSLRRSARAVAGKHWTLVEVDAGEPSDVGLEGLSEPEGPLVQAERLLATTVDLGSWDKALGRLAESLAPDSWGPDRCVLRGYLALTFARVQAEGLLAVSDNGSRAWFDTGLLAVEGTQLYAKLSAGEGDIPWRLDGFSTEL